MSDRKFLIVGWGSIARRHCGNLRSLAPNSAIAVLRQHSRTADDGPLGRNVDQWFFDLPEALGWGPDGVLVCNPAPMHAAVALPFIHRGSNLFIEKPLAADLDDALAIRQASLDADGILLPGYHLRYHPMLNEMRRLISEGAVGTLLSLDIQVGQYLPDWRPGTDYSRGVSARRELGGGALLELSHELDYALLLCGRPQHVMALAEKVSSLTIETEDLAEVIVQFAGGAVARIHLDMLQRVPSRTCRVVGTEGTLFLDLLNAELSLARPDMEGYPAHQKSVCDGNEPYLLEMEHFLACMDGAESPVQTVVDAFDTLQLVTAAKLSAMERSWRAV